MIHARPTFFGATLTKRHQSIQHPLAVLFMHKWTTAVTLTTVGFAGAVCALGVSVGNVYGIDLVLKGGVGERILQMQ
jgi:hypothetical protein